MKIWILNAVALKPTDKGITRHFDLSKYMVRKGHEVTIFASSFLAYHFSWRDPDKKRFRETVDGVAFQWVWTLPYKGNGVKRILNMMSYFITVIYESIRTSERPDVVVGSSVHLFAALAGYFVAKIKRAHYIVEIRDLWPRTLIDFGAMSKYHPVVVMFGLIEKFVYKKAEKIIVTLPGAPDYIERLGINRDKIEYVPNGIDFERVVQFSMVNSLSKQIDDIRKRHGAIAMYVGAHGVANALPTVIESAKESKVAYVFVGEGPEKDSLVKLAEGYDNIYFFDSIPKEQVLSVLQEADVLLVSMLNTKLYQFGISLNKLNDYLLAGKPIVFAGNVLNSIVELAQAGIVVPPENPKLFKEAVESLVTLSEEEKQNISRCGQEYLDQNHNIQKLADRFVSICNQLHMKERIINESTNA